VAIPADIEQKPRNIAPRLLSCLRGICPASREKWSRAPALPFIGWVALRSRSKWFCFRQAARVCLELRLYGAVLHGALLFSPCRRRMTFHRAQEATIPGG
jgi:hypothetical protein